MNSLYNSPGHGVVAAAPAMHRLCQGSLTAGKAVRLHARRRSVLRISEGRLWATFDGPHRGAANDLGDLVLDPGDSLDLAPGRNLVIQSWGALTADPVQFSLDTAVDDCQPCAQGLPAPTRWQATVQEPALRLAESAGHMAQALGALLVGLASYAEFLVAGRGRVLGRFESNAP